MTNTTIINLNANENPLGSSPKVIKKLTQMISKLHLYPQRDDSKICHALTDYYQEKLSAQHFCVANSGCEIIELITRAFLTADSETIICPPTFHIYEQMAKRQQSKIVKVPLKTPDFTYDLDSILNAVTAKTRLIFTCNPNNPTGSTLPTSQLHTLLQKIPQNVTIVADEVYHHFSTQSDIHKTLNYTHHYPNLFVVQSFSKAYGLAGMRLGYAVAHPKSIQKIRRFYRTFHLSSLAIEASIAALSDEQHLQKSVALVRQQRQFIGEALQKLQIRSWPSEGNFILIQPQNATRMYEYLIQNNIFVRKTDKSGLVGGLRISIGLPQHNRILIDTLTQYTKRRDV